MKRFLILVVLVLLMFCCVTGCNDAKESNDDIVKVETPNDEITDEAPITTIVPPIQNGGNYDGEKYD